MIRAVYAENIAIIGENGSVIDGCNIYDPDGEVDYRGPHGIDMHFCRNVKFSGYTFVDAGNWAHAIFQSENISFEDLTVIRGHDALHTRAYNNVSINRCKLETGDDCIAGFNNNNVVIQDCELSSACSAFRYGGNNILIENCKVYGPCKYQHRYHFTKEEKMSGALYLENIQYSVRDDAEKHPFIRAAKFEKIELKNLKISNYTEESLMKVWGIAV